ncbi:uncharacterized protein GGS22DRAFT_195829 [Annulohypoxylon maeteangense]|uniref:uncharacterized protein n=1 Tax=Annulohypoxylon maeteangense TaxID=1927788 RepID=UPI002008DCE2|nr:uncharacterized protein GGS22DRAFT_195829 [Annulohypoxylon maeteangense]KAI0882609.1 hypothetical protein GGS22DRAFT_195829 [Annulohypoxylon maeteangense]
MSTCANKLSCAAVTVNADPDIAGTGVILAFLISAWSSLVIITVEYFSLHGDDVNFNSNALDELLKGYIWKLTKRFSKPWTLGEVQPAILLVSDQQLITGIAILTVGYIQHCTISQYHFYIVYLLGFMSSQVYDASLHALNLYVNRRPSMKLWRVILMNILFGMLIFNAFVVDHDEFLVYEDDDDIWYLGSSTQCVWNNFIGTSHYRSSLLDLILSLIVLIWAYLGDMQLFYPHIFKPLDWFIRVIQTPLLGLLRFHDYISERMSGAEPPSIGAHRVDTETNPGATCSMNSFPRKLSHIPLLIIQFSIWFLLLPSFTLIEILTSRIVDLWRIYSALLWATISVIKLGKYASSHQSIQGDESGWGFGQILPLLLLLLPATSVLEIYQGE